MYKCCTKIVRNKIFFKWCAVFAVKEKKKRTFYKSDYFIGFALSEARYHELPPLRKSIYVSSKFMMRSDFEAGPLG